MSQSMIGFIVALVALLIAGFMMARRYRHEHHPSVGMPRWLDVHHINWVTRKPDVDPKNDNLP